MSYSITPTSGIDLEAVVQTNPNSAGTGVPVNGPLGSQVFGADGKRYVLAVAGEAISASTSVVAIDATTFEASATGGEYVSPATAVASGEYAWFGKASV
jgi:hypothetical protein